MPRKSLQRTNDLPYHIGARTNNREDFHLGLEPTWKILTNESLFISLIFGVKIQSLVMMPNHFHMILTVPQYDLGRVMNHFISNVTRAYNRIADRKGHLFGGPYFRSVIDTSRYYGHAYKYVYRNPVKANLCNKVEEYPFSTIYGLLGQGNLPFPIHQPRSELEIAIPGLETYDRLEWLNRAFSKEAELLIKRGLRRRRFNKLTGEKSERAYRILDNLI
jgi:putative transposase